MKDRKPRISLPGLGNNYLNLALGGGSDLGMLSAALAGLERDLQETLLDRATSGAGSRAEAQPMQETTEEDNSDRELHHGIVCDECRRDGIRGDRYKCG